jgi:hypothetical protein
MLLLSATLFGFAAGILLATLTLGDLIRTTKHDCANHLLSARKLSAKLARERQKTEHLTTQTESLLRYHYGAEIDIESVSAAR